MLFPRLWCRNERLDSLLRDRNCNEIACQHSRRAVTSSDTDRKILKTSVVHTDATLRKHFDAEDDATDAILRTVSRWSLGRWRAGLIEQEATEITEFRFHFNKYLKGQSDALAVFKGVGDDS